MKNHRQPARFQLVTLLALVTLFSVAWPSVADGQTTTPITISRLQGPWAMTLIGITGCGNGTSWVTFTLDAAGVGSATIQSHTSGCGDLTSTDLPFKIQTLNANGSGTANLSCGFACGWEFKIQVNRLGTIFTVVDVDSQNPGNYLQGTAIHQ